MATGGLGLTSSTRPRIVVTRRPPGSVIDRLKAVGDVWVWEEDAAIPGGVLIDQAATAVGLYTMLTDSIDAVLLDRAPLLKVVSNMAVGVDNIDLRACTERGIAVGHTPGVLTETTADMAFALLMAAARRVVEGVDYVRAGKWRRWEPDLLWGHDVHRSTLGIVGMGRIGQAVARRAVGFDMRILYHGPRRKPAVEAELGAVYRTLPGLLREADHVVLATPYNAATHHMIDAEALALMKTTATLVNIGRGGVVDHTALEEALRAGRPGAAALDVTEPEPLPADYPLLALPNCIVVPHLGSSTQRTRIAMAELAADNLIAGIKGERLPACANPEVYSGGGRSGS